MKTNTHRRALVMSTTALLAGIVTSLAGNLQAINLDNAKPGVGAYVAAMIWPSFLFIAIEVMLHTPWVRGWRDDMTRWAGLLGVAFLSFWISYGHMAHVLASYGYDTVASHVGPLAVDVTMTMAALALNRVGKARAAQPVGEAKEEIMVTAVDILPEDLDTLIGDEAQSWLDNLTDRLELNGTTTPAIPVSAPPATSNAVKPESVPELARTMFKEWAVADGFDRPIASEMYIKVGEACDVSPRTARRWYAAVKDQLV